MSKPTALTTLCFALLVPGSAYTPVTSQTRTPEPVAVEQKATRVTPAEFSYTLSYLCNNLHQIKNVPYDPSKKANDPVYDGLRAKGRAALPCLIEKITDTTPMPDPGSAPAIWNFRVGDLTVFIILDITGENWQPRSMFPPEYARKWKANGVYTFKEYMNNPANRVKMQGWWKRWLKKHPGGKNAIPSPGTL